MSTLFNDINLLIESIKNNQKSLDLRGISLGKVCFINTLGLVKVVDVNSNQNYVSQWLRPIKEMKQVYLNDYVLYSYPTSDLDQGIYFDVFSSDHDSPVDPGDGVTIDQVNEAIETSLALYDTMIKDWVLTRNYTTLASVQAWVNSQGYTTESWVDSNFTRPNEVIQPLNVWRYSVNYFNQLSKGNVAQLSDQYADRHVTLMCLGSRLPDIGGSQDAAPEIGLTFDGSGSGLEQRFDVNTEIYLRVNTTARIHIKWFNGITVNGVLNSSATANTGTLMPMRTCWKLTKTASKTWSLVDMNNFNFVPYN